MIFEAPQSELFRLKFNLLSFKILKIPEFNLQMIYLKSPVPKIIKLQTLRIIIAIQMIRMIIFF